MINFINLFNKNIFYFFLFLFKILANFKYKKFYNQKLYLYLLLLIKLFNKLKLTKI